MTEVKEKIDTIATNTAQRARRWSPEEKRAIVQETYQPGMSVSIIARKYGILPNQLFYWRRCMENGALTGIKANEEVVPISEYKVMQKRVRELERALGRASLDVEILKEAVRIGRKKKLISQQPLEGMEDFR
jgi:transposase